MRLLGAAGALFVTAAISADARATMSEALSLSELVQQSEHAVLVTALQERARRDARGRIVTDFTVRVEEVMKGPSRIGSTMTMTRLGGVMGDLGMRIEGEPHLMIGRRYVLFLHRTRDGRTLRPVGMSQGVLPVEEQGGTTIVMPGGSGLSLVQRVQGGQLIAAPPALVSPEPYVRLRERVGGIVDSQRLGTVAP